MPWLVLKWYLTKNCSPAAFDPLEGVRAEAVHVAVARRDAPVAEQPGEHVGRLGREREEVPHVVRLLAVGVGVGLLGVDEVGELEGVADEEDRGVVAHQVVVAVLGVELDREAPRVAHGFGRTPAAGHGREAHEHLGALADPDEEPARVHPDTSAVTSKCP